MCNFVGTFYVNHKTGMLDNPFVLAVNVYVLISRCKLLVDQNNADK